MIFEEDKYYKYMQKIEHIVISQYVVGIILSIMSIFIIKTYSIIIIPIIFLYLSIITLKSKIQAQEMRMRIDIYEKIIKK